MIKIGKIRFSAFSSNSIREQLEVATEEEAQNIILREPALRLSITTANYPIPVPLEGNRLPLPPTANLYLEKTYYLDGDQTTYWYAWLDINPDPETKEYFIIEE